MKFLVVLSVLAAVALAEDKPSAEPVVAPVLLAPIKGSGVSSQYHSQDNLGNYAYGYDEGHATGGSYRRESGSPGVKVGSYGLRDADGHYRTVNYVADALGYRADIQSNEPGVEPSNPASASINKSPAVVVPAAAPKLYSQLLPAQVLSPVVSAPQIVSQVAHIPSSAPKLYSQLLPASVSSAVPQVLSPVVSAPQIVSQLHPVPLSAPKLYSQLLPVSSQVLPQVVYSHPQIISHVPRLYSPVAPQLISAPSYVVSSHRPLKVSQYQTYISHGPQPYQGKYY